MSLFFKHFHRTPFWSQLLLGIFAVFALPEIQAIQPNENEQETVIKQSVAQSAQPSTDTTQQSLFMTELNDISIEFKPQAVIFIKFFTHYYRLDKYQTYSIRAGPFA